MLLLPLILACTPAMLRPAHSLGKLEGSGNLVLLADPTAEPLICVEPGECGRAPSFPVDFEYRLGLGRGWDLGVRGLLPPRALSLKYAALDERRHVTPLSIALSAEGGLVIRSTEISPTLRADLLTSATFAVGPAFAIRPALTAGWWREPRRDGSLDHGPGVTAGLIFPIAIGTGLAVSPYAGGKAWWPQLGAAEVDIRLGLMIEPWFAGEPIHGGG